MRQSRRAVIGMGVAGAAALITPLRKARALEDSTTVRIADGVVKGVESPTAGVNAWLGIPYAAPPVGELRWQPPRKPQPWTGVRAADRFSNSPWAPDGPANMNEDCLTINVWAPRARAEKPRAVMVWIYGGAFVSGTSDLPAYHGDRMAAADVVFVSFNYRVGVLGFYAHAELSRESPHGVSGNYGLLDQLAALRWVQQNIAAFGGDPNNVTIFGQSAGAFSVGFHYVLPQSKGLFHRGIVQSGAPLGRPSSYILLGELRPMEHDGTDFMREVGAHSLADLRAMSAAALVEANRKSWRFYPAIDGELLPEHPYRLIQQRRHNDVPLIAGFNHNEGSIFPPLGGGTVAGLESDLAAVYGPDTAAAQALFPAKNDSAAAAQGLQAFADIVFNWNTAALVALQTRYGRAPARLYHFEHIPGAGISPPFPAARPGNLGAYHGAEIKYALRTLEPAAGSADRKLSRQLSTYWLNFAQHGDPNGAGLTPWPVFAAGRASVLHFGANSIAPGPLPYADRLKLLGHTMQRPILDDVTPS